MERRNKTLAWQVRRGGREVEQAWQRRLAAERRQEEARQAADYRCWLKVRWLTTLVAALLMYAWTMVGTDWFPRGAVHLLGHILLTVSSLGNTDMLMLNPGVWYGHVRPDGWVSSWQYWLACAGGVLGELGFGVVLAGVAPAWLRGAGIGLYLSAVAGLFLPDGPFAGELFRPEQSPVLCLAWVAALALLPVLMRRIVRDRWRSLSWGRILPDDRSIADTVAAVRRGLAARGFYDRPPSGGTAVRNGSGRGRHGR